MGRRKYAIVERLDGRVVVVTGGSSGIGKATAHQLAAAGAHVFIFARSEEKTRPIIQDIIAATKNDKVEFVQVDLCSLDGVKAAAAKFLERGLPLHTLVCNAGSGKSVGVTKDGFEHLFAQNYLSHFLLTMLLLPRLRETQAALPPGSVRIVNVSSSVCISAPKINFDDLKVASQVPTYKISAGPYARSKLAQVLCAKRLAKELEGTGINVYSLNPGTFI
jgi:NAD(P)-dependent dehydrogenase (short-subunit alcohol dehydrogenase family)